MSNKIAALVLLAISALFVGYAVAGSLTFADVCTPARYVQRGTDLLVYCADRTWPWLTLKNCRNARVTLDRTKTRVTINCEW